MMWRLLICNEPADGSAFQMTPQAVEAALARAGGPRHVQPRFIQSGDPAMEAAIAASDAIVGWNFPTALIARSGAQLRLIQSVNAGVDSLSPFDWLPPGAKLCNASGIHARKLQEWAAMVLLMLHGRLPYFVTAQRDRRWDRIKTPLIAGKTALIFGTGGLGGAVASAARGLCLRSIGVSRRAAPAADFDRVLSLDEGMAQLGDVDFVILTLPLTPQTRHIAGAGFFASMRPGAGFANFGRGPLVDQAALCTALRAGTPGGAVLDVTTPEPPAPESPLWDAPNLILTPHVSCDDPETYVAGTLDRLMDNLMSLDRGDPPRNAVDIARGY